MQVFLPNILPAFKSAESRSVRDGNIVVYVVDKGLVSVVPYD